MIPFLGLGTLPSLLLPCVKALAHCEQRSAHYYCVAVMLHSAHDPQPIIAEGQWHGEILREPRGCGGFGYDPLFLDPRRGVTGAQMSIEEKNRVGHRGQALARLLDMLSARLERDGTL